MHNKFWVTSWHHLIVEKRFARLRWLSASAGCGFLLVERLKVLNRIFSRSALSWFILHLNSTDLNDTRRFIKSLFETHAIKPSASSSINYGGELLYALFMLGMSDSRSFELLKLISRRLVWLLFPFPIPKLPAINMPIEPSLNALFGSFLLLVIYGQVG